MTRLALLLCLLPALAAASDKFRLAGDVLIYDTESGGKDREIARADVDRLRKLLADNPEIATLQLNSSGGSYFPAFDMADIVIDFELDTRVDGVCESSCVYVFLGGTTRTMARGSKIGFHHNSWDAGNIESFYTSNKEEFDWDDPFDFAAWLYEDTQQETYLELSYYVRRGVDAAFAIETIRNRGDGLWHPYRPVLLAAGVLTE